MQSFQHLPPNERVNSYLRRADEFRELHRVALCDQLKILYLDMAQFMTERAMAVEDGQTVEHAR